MISVIVPVFNVEPYLPRCLDSIIAQTCRELEILVIDDGSTDCSGEICDSYAEKDPRIRVFHTENRGLSSARNLGLDRAKGDYIGFVDSDDWIEPDMYECLLDAAIETGADVVECGFYSEFPDKTVERKKRSKTISGPLVVQAAFGQGFSNAVWNKLWKRRCFDQNRFPDGRVYEDIATTYLLFASADCIHIIPASKYHYRNRRGSISKARDMKNFADRWASCMERYDFLLVRADKDARSRLLRGPAAAAATTWAYYYDCPAEERIAYQKNNS